jgi:hypothetical protein
VEAYESTMPSTSLCYEQLRQEKPWSTLWSDRTICGRYRGSRNFDDEEIREQFTRSIDIHMIRLITRTLVLYAEWVTAARAVEPLRALIDP